MLWSRSDLVNYAILFTRGQHCKEISNAHCTLKCAKARYHFVKVWKLICTESTASNEMVFAETDEWVILRQGNYINTCMVTVLEAGPISPAIGLSYALCILSHDPGPDPSTSWATLPLVPRSRPTVGPRPSPVAAISTLAIELRMKSMLCSSAIGAYQHVSRTLQPSVTPGNRLGLALISSSVRSITSTRCIPYCSHIWMQTIHFNCSTAVGYKNNNNNDCHTQHET